MSDLAQTLTDLFTENAAALIIGGAAAIGGEHLLKAWRQRRAGKMLKDGLRDSSSFQITETPIWPSGRLRAPGREYWIMTIRIKEDNVETGETMHTSIQDEVLPYLEKAYDWCLENDEPVMFNALLRDDIVPPKKRPLILQAMQKAMVKAASSRLNPPQPLSAALAEAFAAGKRMQPVERQVVVMPMAEGTYQREMRLFYIPKEWLCADFRLDPADLILLKGNQYIFNPEEEHQYQRAASINKALEFLRKHPEICSELTVNFWTGQLIKAPRATYKGPDHLAHLDLPCEPRT